MADARLDGISSVCVDDATLAAFVDGTLDPVSRQRVVAHLASCADCSELVTEVIRTEEELSESAATQSEGRMDRSGTRSPGTPRWNRRQTFAAVGGLGALAASVLLFTLNRGTALDSLVEIVGHERLTAARPTGEFHYGPLRSPLRGSGETENLELRAEAARLRDRAARTGAAEDLHASGVAQLLAGDTASSVSTLESAARSRPDNARYLADLGAAYVSRFLERGDQADASSALDAIEKALALAPGTKEAWFNKALLLQRLNRRDEALATWAKYLALPDDGGWRDEAIRHRDALQRQ